MIEAADVVEGDPVWKQTARKISEASCPSGPIDPYHARSVVRLEGVDVILVERAACSGYGGSGCQSYIRLGSGRRYIAVRPLGEG